MVVKTGTTPTSDFETSQCKQKEPCKAQGPVSFQAASIAVDQDPAPSCQNTIEQLLDAREKADDVLEGAVTLDV